MTSLQAGAVVLLVEEGAGGPDALQCAESAVEQVALGACGSAAMGGNGLLELVVDLTLQRLGRALQGAEGLDDAAVGLGGGQPARARR
ncbi:hypothetical protein ACFW2I_38615 [Streptomyces nigra]|uniref:hypothetical protein n=1 Tax=Streptomyces nigra TaxID=1827580 RepID=UPI00369084AC